ncbi:MAG: sensor domain-containing protein [Kibdelosporangium sp.]
MLKQWGRSAGYLAAVGFSAPVSMPLLMLLPMTGLSFFAAGLGFVLLPIVVMLIRLWTDVHRHLTGWILNRPVQTAYQPLQGGVLARFRQVMVDSTTWRDLLWVIVQLPLGFVLGVSGMVIAAFGVAGVAVALFWWAMPEQEPARMLDIAITNWGLAIGVGLPTALVGLGLAWFGIPLLARMHATVSRLLLSPSRLASRVEQLSVTRAGAVNAHDAELRRIERDLHDGTQARLVSIAMRLGVAEKSLDARDPVGLLVREAREGAEQAMGELRDVIRTMYPPILADRGLDGAVAALAARCPVEVAVQVEDLGKVPAPVQAAAYFVVAEALTNVAKHSNATGAAVRLARDSSLMITVTDNGFGGVDESRGTGVVGIRRRVAALDGTVTVDSPAGGPTRIGVQIPLGAIGA